MTEKSEIQMNPSEAAPQSAQTPPSETLYAGKYKSVEELVAGYEELQKQFSSKPAETPPETPPAEKPATTIPDDPQGAVQGAGLDWDGLNAEYAEHGKLSDETYAKLEQGGIPRAAVDTYIKGKQAEADAYDAAVYGSAGGEQEYAALITWAKGALTAEEKAAFNEAVTSNNPAIAKLAVEGLAARRAATRGTPPGKMLDGRSAPTGIEPFKSAAELTAAMSDKRYRTDSAYRELVRQRLAESDVL